MAAHAMLESKADDVDLSMGISTQEAGKLAAIKAIGKHTLKKLMAEEVVEATSGAGKPKKSKAKKVAKVEVASNSDLKKRKAGTYAMT